MIKRLVDIREEELYPFPPPGIDKVVTKR